MPRTLLGFVAAVAFVLPFLTGRTGSTAELVIRLDVRPAPAPTPALRYRLLPELKEMNPGNPIQGYMKCMMGQKSFLFDEDASRHRETLLAMPLKELPAEDLKDYGRIALRQVDRAARLDTPDWQTLLKLRADGIELLLPEVQQIRSLARALQVRYRAEIAQARFDEALRTAQTMFAISRHLGEHPTLIGDLVGIAIASLAIGGLDEMLEQPGCPNLYWALTNLPSPLIPLERGMEGERVMQSWVFRGLADTAPMSKERLDAFVADTEKMLGTAEGKPDEHRVRAWLDARTEDEAVVAAARRRLVGYGLPEERLARFPPDQVILLDEKRELEVRFDDEVKTISFPAWQAEALLAQVESKKPPALFADLLVPTLLNVRHAQARLDQRIALLRHVEGLRLHSAEHDGTWPAKLCDVSVPLPLDPFTGKPFCYEVAGDTAHLRGSPPPGKGNIPQFNIHYEVTLQE